MVWKNIAKVPKLKVTRWLKCFSFFLSSSSSDGLVQNCITLFFNTNYLLFLGLWNLHLCLVLFFFSFAIKYLSHMSLFILSTISQLPLSLWWSLLLVLQWWVNWATPSAALSVEQTLSAPPPPPTVGTMRAVIPGHKLGPPVPTASFVCDHTMLGNIHVRWQ